jgi:hypothetical protein
LPPEEALRSAPLLLPTLHVPLVLQVQAVTQLPLHTRPALLREAALMNVPLPLSKPVLLPAVALKHAPLPKPL